MSHTRPDSYLELEEEPAIGYPTIKPQEGHAVDFIAEQIKNSPETYATKLFMEISGPNHENNPEYTNTLWDEVTVLYLLDSSFVTASEEHYNRIKINYFQVIYRLR